MWSQDDSGSDGLNWEEALAWVEAQNDANYLGYSDWRLPNVKELQSIVDYTRSPDTTDSAAIDPLFNATRHHQRSGRNRLPLLLEQHHPRQLDGSSGTMQARTSALAGRWATWTAAWV